MSRFVRPGERAVAGPVSVARPTASRRPWAANAALAACACVVAFILFPLSDPGSRDIYLAVAIGVYAIAGSGLAVVYGDSGHLSIAHGTIVGVGAYATVLTLSASSSVLVACVTAVAGGIALAVLVGVPALRLSGHYFVITTFAIAEAISVVASNTQVVGGTAGKSMPPPTGILGQEWGLYFMVFGVLALVALTLELVRRTQFGAGLHAIRENEPLARSLGRRVPYLKVTAFAASGAICGIAGFFLAFANLYVSPRDVGSQPGIVLVLILILGGASHWLGPVAGAVVYFGLPYVFPLSAAANQVAIGLLLVIVVLLLPSGIVGSVGDLAQRVAHRGRAEKPTSE